MSPNEPAASADPRRTMWIIYAALCSSTLAYLVVLSVQQSSGALEGLVPDATFAIAIGATALVVAATSVALPRYLYAQALANLELHVVDVPDPDGSVMFRDRAPTIRMFADPAAVRARVHAIFFTPLILRLALSEAVAIFGVVLGLMGHPWATVLPFFGVAWVLLALAAPRDAAIYGPVAQVFEARFE